MVNKIGIDARLYSKTGVGVYIRNLLHYLPNISGNIEYLLYILPEDASRLESYPENVKIRIAPYRWHSFSEQIKFLYQITQDNLTLMHFTYFGHPMLYRKPFISTIHDTIMLDYKTGRASTKFYPVYVGKHAVFKLVFANQVLNSKKIIVPTNYVAGRLCEMYGKKYRNKIHVIGEGVNYGLINAAVNNERELSNIKEHFLYVGNFYPHKNVEQLIYAFLDSDARIPLVLAGPDDHFYIGLKKLLNKIDKNSRIKFVTNSDESMLVKLYQKAEALIHPSLAEGFCLPIIEAAHFKTPIIASDIPVFHELINNNYISFDPFNKVSITQAINRYLREKPSYDNSDLLKKYTFEKMANATLDVYRSAL